MSRNSRSKITNLLEHQSRMTRGIATVIVLCLAGAIATSAFIASAAVPAFPSNILIFPDRDFISLQGFASHATETATVEVTRAGKVIGSAKGVVSGGDVAFEINHPGGVCWGNGTALQVTPDIRPGDTATISFGGTAAGDTTVQDAMVKTVDHVAGSTSVVVHGRANLDPGVSPDNLEQRTVNPDLVALIGKRDVRAIPGPVVPAATGGYSSGLTIDAATNTFTATYEFASSAVADVVASGGGERLLSWQLLDGAGNRQGVTIAEFGQLGGPGIGGCPNGPAAQVPPTPRSVAVVRSAGKTSIQVAWAAVTAVPAADPVDGYSVELVAATTTAAGQQQIGLRTSAGVTKAAFSGLDPAETYAVEVRSLAAGHASDPGVPSPPADTAAPTLTATPAPGANGAIVETDSVTLSSNGSIYYTIDSSSPVNGDMPSNTSKLYTSPISITAETPLRAIAFDQAGNISPEVVGKYAPPSAAPAPPPASSAPAIPTGLTATGGVHQVALKWTASDTATDYRIVTYDDQGVTVGTPTASTTTSATVSGLTAGKRYTFTVAAHNSGGWSAESAKTAPELATDSVAITTAKWKVGDMVVTGSGSDFVTGATVTLYDASNTAIGSATPVTAAVAPATGMTFSIRLRNGATPSAKPATVYVKSSLGGVSAKVTVAAG